MEDEAEAVGKNPSLNRAGQSSWYINEEERTFRGVDYVTKYEDDHTRIQLAVHEELTTELREEDFTVVISGDTFFTETHNVASPGVWVR